MSATASWQSLQRQARAERRREGGAVGPGAAPATMAALAALAAVEDPAVVAARLDEARRASPALHARLVRLDPSQQAAVVTDDEATLVRAQVGSGKTTVLVHRALYLHLVRGVPLEQLAILTFTTRAADELRARLDEVAGRRTTSEERWLMGTFHAVAMALLQRVLPVEQVGRRRGFAVLDEDGLAALCDELARAHRLRVGQRRTLRERLRQPATDELRRLAALVAEAKRDRNLMDFDDLIEHASGLLAAPDVPRPRWVLVDELQDCEPRELELVRRLRGPRGGFFGVGDPRQAIYGWRGGLADGFAHAAAALGCVVRELPRSYRSTRTILDGARAVLGEQPSAGGELVAVRPAGAPIIVRRHRDADAEGRHLARRLAALHAGGVRYSELAVLCRLRAQVEALVAVLEAEGVPCTGVDDDPAGALAAGTNGGEASTPEDVVRVMTLHAAKGLELTHVFIAGVNLGVLPLVVRERIDDEAEERRLLFVGLTRARETVELSYVAQPQQFAALGVPSPLVYQLPAEVVEWHDGSEPAPAVAVPSSPPGAVPSPPPAAVSGSSWREGQAVRHPRYGVGVIVRVAGDAVECEFGKLGAKAFPLRMCPLTAAAAAP